MALFKRREPASFTVRVPSLDGTSWTEQTTGARRDFAARTAYDSGYRNAFDPPAPDTADRLVALVLPAAEQQFGSSPEDRPYVEQLLMSAAQVGAGLASVDPDVGAETDRLDPVVAGAFLLADDEITTATADQRRWVRFLLQAGHYVVRHGDAGWRRLPHP